MYKLTEEQRTQLLNILAETPLKFSINAFVIVNNLEKIKEEEKEKSIITRK